MAAASLGGAELGERGQYEAGPGDAWELITTPPARPLRTVVERYVGYVERSQQPLRRLETPGVGAKLIFLLGTAMEISAPDHAAQRLARSFFVRFSALPAVTQFQGVAAGIEVGLTPIGAAALLGQAMDEVPDPVVELDLLIGIQADLLTEQLAGLDSWDRRFELLDEFLLNRLTFLRQPPPMIDWTWQQLLVSGGNVQIADLAKKIGCSHAYLSRSFRQHIGLSPKASAAILRFSRADRLLGSDFGRLSLAELAAACGYHDQSHMTREFRRFTGITPAAYAESLRHDFLGVPGS